MFSPNFQFCRAGGVASASCKPAAAGVATPFNRRCSSGRKVSSSVRGGVEARSSKSKNGANRGPLVLIDNYDSFTYNLSQYLGDLGCEHTVIFNDEKTVEEIVAMNPKGILVSPGPGRPEDSGISLEIIEGVGGKIPVFGVCMGHQCIGQVFGGSVIRAPCGVMHGKTSLVHHKGRGVMKGLPNPFEAARYHSLVIEQESCPDCLEVTAWCEDGTIMGVRHKELDSIEGVQFHPESIITDSGKKIVKNFVDLLD
ncbi:hypothetical protein BSKO_10750 [Bryopsis sp. KO-2023]|nr:hypothetical protein BSKO_10750 [Bryopsis sp. KO-2023]